MYHRPAWRRSKVHNFFALIAFDVFAILLCYHYLIVNSKRFISFSKVLQACTENSPYEGPFQIDAPSWCHAPFEPEGILR